MWKRIWDYIIVLYHDVPSYVYICLIVAFCLGAILLWIHYGLKKGTRLSMLLLLVEYVILIFLSTVFFRTIEQNYQHDFSLFWSYKAVYEGKGELTTQIIMNVVVFIPLGALLGGVLMNKSWRAVALIGLLISILIEVLQFVMKRGFAEFDDVFNNTLGCLIGYGIYSLVRYGYKKIGWRSLGIL